LDRVAGSARSISILKKIQNGVILVKKNKTKKTKVNGLQPGFAGSTRRVDRVKPGHDFSYFFFNPARFQPRVGRVPSQPVGPGRVSKLC
jgi:hypothetical protein